MKPEAGQVWEEGYPEDEARYTYLVLGKDYSTWRVLVLEGRRDTAGKVTYLGDGWFDKPWSRRIA